MFDLDQFIADCRAALEGEHSARNVRDVVARAVSDPAALMGVIGEPREGGLNALHRSDDLTIVNVLWRPNMVIMPHDHRVWAVVGVYSGREDNILWRRLPADSDRQIEAAGAKSLSAGDALALGRDVVHSVINPIGRVTGAIHVYGGDFFAVERSEWHPETLREQPYDTEKARRMFAGDLV